MLQDFTTEFEVKKFHLTAQQQNSGHLSKCKREQVNGSEDRILINWPRTQECGTSKMKVRMCGAIMEYASELRQDANNGQQRQHFYGKNGKVLFDYTMKT